MNQISSERMAKREQELLESFMNNATDRFYILDEKLNIVTVNDTSLKRYGFSRQQVVGRNFFDVFPSIQGTGRRDAYQRVLKTGESYSTVDKSDPDDQFRLLAFRIEGGMGLIVTDITEIMAYQSQLEALHACEVVHTERLKKLHVYSQIVGQVTEVGDLVGSTLDAMESLFKVDVYGFLVVIQNSLRSCGVRGLNVPASSLLDFSVKGVAQGLLRGKDVEIDMPPGGLSLDSQGVTVRAIKQNRTQLVNDLREDPEYVPSIEDDFKKSDFPHRLSELATPIYVDETPFGVLNLESSMLNAFDQQDLELLEVMAGQLAVTLKRMKLEGRMKELHAYIQRLSKASTIRDLVESTIETMESLFEIVVCDFLVIIDNRLQSIATRGPELPPPEDLRVDGRGISQAFFPSGLVSPPVAPDVGLNLEGAGICARAIRQREPQLVGDIRIDPDYVVYPTPTSDYFKEKGIEVLSELAVPIVVDGMPFGVLNLESGKLNGYSPQDLELLEILANQVGIVVSNMRVFNATTKKLILSQEQYGVLSNNLHRHALRLAVVNGLDEIAQITNTAIKEILGFTRVGLGIIERDGLRYHSIDAPTTSGIIPLDGPGITIRAVKSGEIQLVPDTEKDPDYITLRAGGPQTRSELVVPIRIEDQVVGVLDLASESVNAFTQQHAKVVEIFSSHVASALNRSRTHELESSRSRLIDYQSRLEALHASSTRLVQANDLVQIAAITVEALHQVMGHVFGEVGFVEDDSFVWYGSTEREFDERPSVPLESRSIIVRAIKTKATQLVPDVSEDPDYTILNVPEEDTVRMSELSVPVLVDDEAVGALNVESALVDDFTQDDVRLLETLAQSVSSAYNRLQSEKILRENEEKYRSLYENSLEGIVIVSPDGNIVSMNPAGAYLYGAKDVEELVGTPSVETYVYPEERRKLFEILGAQGYVKDYEIVFKKLDGSHGTASCNVTINTNDDGEILRVETFLRDITEHKRMEDDLRRNQALLQSFMNNATDRFYMLDEDLNIVAVNEAVLKRFGFFLQQDIIGKPITELFPQETGRVEVYKRVIETGELYTSIDSSLPDNKFQISAFKIEDGIGLIATEITDLLNYQNRLEALNKSSAKLVEAVTMEQISATGVEVIETVLGHSMGAVGFVEGENFVIYDALGFESEERIRIPLDSSSVIIRAIKAKETQIVQDTEEDPDYLHISDIEEQRRNLSMIAVPILLNGQAVGALDVESLLKNAFTQDDARLLETLAIQISSAFGRLQADQTRARQSIELTYRLNNLESGDSYICESHDRCYKVFSELSMHGVPGLCIVRDDPGRIVERYGLDRESVLLLASRSIRGFSAINDLQEISLTLSKTLKEAHEPIILLDGIEYMITMFGFERVFNFLQEKKFDILEAEAILLLPIDTMTLNDQQKALLSSELKTLT